MRNIKAIIWDIKGAVYIAFCLIFGGILAWRSVMRPLPVRSQLAVIDGVVAEVGIGTRAASGSDVEFPVVRLKGCAHEFRYLDWFPAPWRMEALNPGDNVRLLSDTNRYHWIWELQKDGQIITSYDEVAAAVQRNNRSDPYLAIFLLALGTGSAVWYVRTLRRKR